MQSSSSKDLIAESSTEDKGDLLTNRESTFIEVLFSEEANGDVKTAMLIAGFPKSTSQTQLVSKLQESILDAARLNLASTSPLAVMSLLSVLTDPTHPGAKNKISAAKEILDRVGVVKEEKKTVDINQRVMFVLPAKEDKPKVINGSGDHLIIDMDTND